MQADINKLSSAFSDGCAQHVHKHLTDPTPSDRVMIEAWAACGRKDSCRKFRLQISEEARKTMTPLGIACLIAYARAYVDALEAQLPKSTE